jgi:hypothetical protein
MNKLPQSTTSETPVQSLDAGAKRGRLYLVAVGAALLLAPGRANAAQPVFVNPATLPDLTVSMAASSPVPAYQVSSLTVTVADAPPTTALNKVTTDSVIVHVDLTGMVAQYAEGPTGFSCQVSNGNPSTPWSAVDCTGPVTSGGNATITVYYEPATDIYSSTNAACMAYWYCGQPAYADASVRYWSGRSERSTTNNRAMSRIDTDGCIN